MTDRYSLIDTQTFDRNAPKFISDPRLLRFELGQEIVCRIVRFTDKLSSRKTPWIIKAVHSVFSEAERNANGDKVYVSTYVTCPSSDYLNIRDWKKSCKVCQAVDAMYTKLRSIQNMSNYDNKRLLSSIKTLKRKFKTFIPVYIISDSFNPENNGTVRILMFNNFDTGFKLEKYISRQEAPNKYFNNFSSPGFNLRLNVNKTNVFDIVPKFEYVEDRIITDFDAKTFTDTHIKPLKFDEDFYEEFKTEAMDSFFSTFALPIIKKLKLSIGQNPEQQTDMPNVNSPDQQPKDSGVYTFSNEEENDNSSKEDPSNNKKDSSLDTVFADILKNEQKPNEVTEPEKKQETTQPQIEQDVQKSGDESDAQTTKEDIDKTLNDIDKFLSEVQI